MFFFLSFLNVKETRSALFYFSSLRRVPPHPLHYPLPLPYHTLLCCFPQSLLTGLMYYRPDDPIEYLEGCLKKARELGGPDKVRWDTFVGQEKKSLPPLNGGQSRRSLFRNGKQGGTPQLTIT